MREVGNQNVMGTQRQSTRTIIKNRVNEVQIATEANMGHDNDFAQIIESNNMLVSIVTA